MSYGDIHGHMGVTEADASVPLLDFSNIASKEFWLRSAGSNSPRAGFVYAGTINDYSYGIVDSTLPVRPALSLLIQ